MSQAPRFHLTFVVAMAENRVIGRDNGLAWHLGSDLKRFKAATLGKPMIMGRKTFEAVWAMGVWPYGDKPVVVLSRSLQTLPAGVPASVCLSGGDPHPLVQSLREHGWQRLYIDGGTTVQGFLQAGLVDELVLTEVPCVLGQGITLWGQHGLPAGFHLQRQHAYPFGFVQRQYLFQPRHQDLRVRKALS